MKTLHCIIGVILVGLSLFYGQEIHDLTIHEIVAPEHWVEDGTPVIPILKIVNLGDFAEQDVPVRLTILNEDDETVYEETANLISIGVGGGSTVGGDTAEVEFPEWLPVGACEDWEMLAGGLPEIEDVGAHYRLTGIVLSPRDENRANDTLRDTSIALLSHDVGVVNLNNMEGYEWGVYYEPYPNWIEFTGVVAVENFGYNEEQNISVVLSIYDLSVVPDSLVWSNTQNQDKLDWRGNSLGNPYISDIIFPGFFRPGVVWYRFECQTAIEGDECEKNDSVMRGIYPSEGKIEIKPPPSFVFDVTVYDPKSRKHTVMFSLPQSTFVELGVYDANGRKVATLAERHFEPGTYFRTWNGVDDAGNMVSAGIYLVRMEAGEFEATEKVVVIE